MTDISGTYLSKSAVFDIAVKSPNNRYFTLKAMSLFIYGFLLCIIDLLKIRSSRSLLIHIYIHMYMVSKFPCTPVKKKKTCLLNLKAH